MKRFYLFALIWLMGLASCQPHQTTSTTEPTSQPTEVSEEPSHTHSAELYLHQGEKWKVDGPMMEILAGMESNLSTEISSSNPQYATLAQELRSGVNRLTSNCTMTGEPHEVLHIWLVPFIGLVDSFANAESSHQSVMAAQIQSSFLTFHQFFQ